MNIFLSVVFLLIGFAILIKCSDIFVDAISSIAINFKMSKLMIALTIGAFGTCAPELAISFRSISSGVGDIALSNVLGSNVVNILLIVGLAACVSPIKVKNSVIKKELPILLLITSVFSLAMAVNSFFVKKEFVLDSLSGVLFLLFFAVFIIYIISVIRAKQGFFERSEAKYKWYYALIYATICCFAIVYASDLVVENATFLAETFKISQKLITMTIVVIGTSLPELTMTVVASKKGEFDIALGNIIGTNIFNIGIVLGLPLVIYGGFSSTSFSLIDIGAVQLAVLTLYYFSINDKTLSRTEGLSMIGLFLLYYTYLFLQ